MRKKMKEKRNLPLYIRKHYILILFTSLLSILLCGIWGFFLLDSLYARELKQMDNITGAVLSEYPDAENVLISALQDTNYNYTNQGYAILKKYGYRNDSLFVSSCYRSFFAYFAALLTFIFLCNLVFISLGFFRFHRYQESQEMQLHTLLDNYLSENYSMPETKESFGFIFNESFTDTLHKLGDKLMAKTRALAEERDQTKTLVTDISHQLKTPVSALSSCLSMCMEADTEEERSDFLQRCALQMNKLESLITVLINISRLETSLISLRAETVLLSDMLTDAINTVYEKALQKNITIHLCDPANEDAASISLLLDRHWTAEAIANILDNAVKYSPAGSTVSLSTRKFYSYVQLEITDQGIGIPKTEYNQIFKRFYRGSHPAVRQTEGSGVGLYLARRIVEEQGGSITVKSAAAHGAVFDVRLPV